MIEAAAAGPTISAYYPHLGVLVLSAVVAWALVEVARRWTRAAGRPSGAGADALLRTLALAVGLLAGYLLGADSPAVGGWPGGALLGVAGGGLCTWAVALGKRWLARRLGDSTPDAGEDGP